MAGPTPHDMIEFLVDRRFPVKVRTGRIVTFDGLIPAAEQIAKAQALRKELEGLTSEDVQVRYENAKEEDRQRALAVEAALSFNQPHAMADFDHWAKFTYWKVDEGIALLLGRSPSALVWDKVQAYSNVSPLIANFARIRELATRAVHWKELFEGNYPGSFLAWAKRKNLLVPPELEERVSSYGHFIGDWKSLYDQLKEQTDKSSREAQKRYDELLSTAKARMEQLQGQIAGIQAQLNAGPRDKPIGTRETESLRKLVIGLAIRGHGYDPTASRSTIIREIAADLVELGIPLDEDTIRKHLKASAELLPPTTAPERQPRDRLK